MNIKPISDAIIIGNDTFDNGYLAHNSKGNICAIVEKHKNTWRVWRIATKNNGDLILGGMDDFYTYEDATRWLQNTSTWR